eukprot:Skav232248  [mRNA]  locus=scaffold273:80522:82856:- [translate_table: standard]
MDPSLVTRIFPAVKKVIFDVDPVLHHFFEDYVSVKYRQQLLAMRAAQLFRLYILLCIHAFCSRPQRTDEHWPRSTLLFLTTNTSKMLLHTPVFPRYYPAIIKLLAWNWQKDVRLLHVAMGAVSVLARHRKPCHLSMWLRNTKPRALCMGRQRWHIATHAGMGQSLPVDAGAGQPSLTNSRLSEGRRKAVSTVEEPLKHWELQMHALVIVMISMEYVTSKDLQEQTKKLEEYSDWGYYGQWAVALAKVLLEKGLLNVPDLSRALGMCESQDQGWAVPSARCCLKDSFCCDVSECFFPKAPAGF